MRDVSLPYKVDTSRPSLRTNWTRLESTPLRIDRRAAVAPFPRLVGVASVLARAHRGLMPLGVCRAGLVLIPVRSRGREIALFGEIRCVARVHVVHAKQQLFSAVDARRELSPARQGTGLRGTARQRNIRWDEFSIARRCSTPGAEPLVVFPMAGRGHTRLEVGYSRSCGMARTEPPRHRARRAREPCRDGA